MATLTAAGKSRLAELTAIEPAGRPLPPTPMYNILIGLAIPLLNVITNLKITGSEHIPKRGPFIAAANHNSHVDPVLVIFSCRRKLFYLAKDEHFQKLGWRQLMGATGQIETDRAAGGEGAIARAADVLSSGRPLGIFPEGTRSRRTSPPYLGPGKTGVARIAAAFPDVPVLVCGIDGARDILAPGEPFLPRVWKRTELRFGSSITWNEWIGEADGGDLSDEEIDRLHSLDSKERREELRKLYRRFTDQTIATLSALGAP